MTIREQLEEIRACVCRQTELYSVWAKQHGMSYSTMMTLYGLDHSGACTQTRLAEAWGLPKQTVHTVLKGLEGLRLVQFTAGRDQKEKLVSLTATGRTYAAECLGDLYRREERAAETMGTALFAALADANRAFLETFDQEVRRG